MKQNRRPIINEINGKYRYTMCGTRVVVNIFRCTLGICEWGEPEYARPTPLLCDLLVPVNLRLYLSKNTILTKLTLEVLLVAVPLQNFFHRDPLEFELDLSGRQVCSQNPGGERYSGSVREDSPGGT